MADVGKAELELDGVGCARVVADVECVVCNEDAVGANALDYVDERAGEELLEKAGIIERLQRCLGFVGAGVLRVVLLERVATPGEAGFRGDLFGKLQREREVFIAVVGVAVEECGAVGEVGDIECGGAVVEADDEREERGICRHLRAEVGFDVFGADGKGDNAVATAPRNRCCASADRAVGLAVGGENGVCVSCVAAGRTVWCEERQPFNGVAAGDTLDSVCEKMVGKELVGRDVCLPLREMDDPQGVFDDIGCGDVPCREDELRCGEVVLLHIGLQ